MSFLQHGRLQRYVRGVNTTLIPFVISIFGHFGAEAERAFHGVTGALRRPAMVDDDVCGEQNKCRQRLLIGLNREIARQLLQSSIDQAVPSAALEALEEQDAFHVVLVSDAHSTRLVAHPVDSEMARSEAALGRALAAAHPLADGEHADVFMQDATPGRLALDSSMGEAVPVVEG